MRLGIRTALICGFLVAMFLFPATSSSVPQELLLGDVDQIFIHARVDQKGVLWVTVNYESREKGRSVYWIGGRVDCDCEVFEYDDQGTDDEEKKGHRITKVSKTILTDKNKISVDIPEKYLGKDQRGIVECSFNTGSEKLKAQDYFRLSYGRGPGPLDGGGYHEPKPIRRERHRRR
ncbi:MAG: hypothetical protein JRI47_09475 [Deltaproteobacteria bacterium]|nr:hypothetical protein [Deltaproteobacteria bacterium]